MTANNSGEDAPRDVPGAPGSEDPDLEAMEALERETALAAGQDRFPVLINVLMDYFVSSDKSLDFLERYQRFGENSAEFEGLAEEIRDAIRNPRASAPAVNAVLNSSLTQQEVRSMLSELLDQMLEQGEYSPDALEQADEEARAARPSPDAMLDYYAKRPVAIPIKGLKQYKLPLWAWGGISLVLILIGVGLLYIPWPEFLLSIPYAFVGIGVLGLGFTVVAMLGLREEIQNPAKEAARAALKEEAQAKREAKQEARGGTLSDRIRRTLS